MVLTGSHGYIEYGEESSFGAGASTMRAFGLEQKLNSLSFKNNQIALSQLNSIEVKSFAYGKNEGTGSVDFVLSNPWIFDTILGNNDKSGSASDYTYTWSSDATALSADNTEVKTPKPFAIDVGLDIADNVTDELRHLKGAIFQSFNIKSSINETVKCTTDFTYGIIDTFGTSLGTPASDDINFPYTFAHAALYIPSGASDPVAEIQDFDITFNCNSELLYQQGSPNAVGAFRKLFEMTGKFNAGYIDKTQLQRVLDRSETASLKITFTNGLSGASEKAIILTFTGVGVSEHSYNIAPAEPIFQDLTFQMRSVSVTANNGISSIPASE